jgi:hypothetical protein
MPRPHDWAGALSAVVQVSTRTVIGQNAEVSSEPVGVKIVRFDRRMDRRIWARVVSGERSACPFGDAAAGSARREFAIEFCYGRIRISALISPKPLMGASLERG